MCQQKVQMMPVQSPAERRLRKLLKQQKKLQSELERIAQLMRIEAEAYTTERNISHLAEETDIDDLVRNILSW